MQFRTDLALEAKEIVGEEIKGIENEVKKYKRMTISRLEVKTNDAQFHLQKPKGTYITIELPSLTDDFKETDERLKIIAENIISLLPEKGLILVAGIGNLDITADALGPKSSSKILATRHISGEIARSIGLDKLRPVAVLTPGVLGQTGIETSELISSVVKKIKPSAVVVIDALASRKLERLGCTMQISNTGISPGAGVGNNRMKLNEETLGVPVIAIGVPTVVDAVTLATDLLCQDEEVDIKYIKKFVSPKGQLMVVTPREIDLLISRGASLISMSLNCALQSDFELSDILSLTSV